MTTQIVVTEVLELARTKAPALPFAPVQYDRQYQDTVNNILRQYFNTLDNFIAQLMANSSTLPISIGGVNTDAFGRIRVSQPYTLFDSQNRYHKDPQFDEAITGGNVSYVANESSVDMNVTGSSQSVVRQSYRSFPYQPGKGLLMLATFVMQPTANVTFQVGYFNTSNGVFLKKSGVAEPEFVLRTNTSGTPSDVRSIPQSSWNGDKLNGTGASGITLDLTKAQILWMDFEWLGVGSVRCGFIIDGQYIICHTFNNANEIDKVYMTTAILPVRYQVTTNSTGGTATLTQICSSVMSEGGYDQKAIPQWARRTTTLTGVSTTFVPIISMRLKSTALGAVVLPSVYHAIPIGSILDYEVVLLKNPTLTGTPSWTSTSLNVEVDVAATGLTGGTIVDLDYVSGSNQGSGVVNTGESYNFDLQLGASIAGVSDIYTLAARTISGSDDIIGALSFYDLTD